MDTVSWGEFERRQPDLAAHLRGRFADGSIAYLATVRPDGFPRVHPIGVNLVDGRLVVPMGPTSPKAGDLRRNGRFALHCTVEDDNGGGGEVLVTGLGQACDPTEAFAARGWTTFELTIGRVQAIDAGRAVTRWTPADE